MSDHDVVEGERGPVERQTGTGRLRLFNFRIRLTGEDHFFPVTAFATTEENARERVIGRFPSGIAEMKLKNGPS